QQHRAALPAADTFSGDAAFEPALLERVGEMKNDPVAARSDRMTKADRATIHIEPVVRNLAIRRIKPQNLAAIFLILPGGETRQHLGRKGLIDLPKIDIFA